MQVSRSYFQYVVNQAKQDYPQIAKNLGDVPLHGTFFLLGHCAGFCISPDGELCCLFSTEKGNGDWLLKNAIIAGCTHLNCFDGYLPTLYAKHGFVEYMREPNWEGEGHPDVVFMRLEDCYV